VMIANKDDELIKIHQSIPLEKPLVVACAEFRPIVSASRLTITREPALHVISHIIRLAAR